MLWLARINSVLAAFLVKSGAYANEVLEEKLFSTGGSARSECGTHSKPDSQRSGRLIACARPDRIVTFSEVRQRRAPQLTDAWRRV